MYFHSWQELFAMGGYARYVWPACAIVAIVLIGNSVQSLHYYRKLIIQLRKQNESIT